MVHFHSSHFHVLPFRFFPENFICVFTGIFKTPQRVQFSQTGASSGKILWSVPGFPVGGLLNGNRVNVTNLKSGQVKTYIKKCGEGMIQINDFEEETNYAAHVQHIGRLDGPPSQPLDFSIPIGASYIKSTSIAHNIV